MTKTTIDIHNCPRAVLGWTHLPAITEYIGNADLKLDIFYQFSTGELLILDEQIINVLVALKIPYEYRNPTNSIRFIKRLGRKK